MADLSKPTSLIPALLLLAATSTFAQTRPQVSDPKALEVVRAAVKSELAAAAIDHNNWIYRDHDTTDTKDILYLVVGSPQGELRKPLLKGGKTPTDADNKLEDQHIQEFISDASAQAKSKKNAAHDDDQATQLIQMLPDAFIWTIVSDSPQWTTLSYRVNPAFDAPNYEARVMSTMEGEVLVTHPGNRIRTLRGALSEDVKFGFGLLGKLYKGGTFDIERREVIPGFWEITESRVHIGGHALLFKNIGQQEDEIKTDWHPSPAKSLQDAAHFLATEVTISHPSPPPGNLKKK